MRERRLHLAFLIPLSLMLEYLLKDYHCLSIFISGYEEASNLRLHEFEIVLWIC
jgi:hypothetical protein